MPKKEELSPASASLLTEQARWIIERYEGINSELLTRSAQMIGFLGVEFGLVLNKLDSLNLLMSLVGLSFMLISILAFVFSAIPKSVTLPDIKTLHKTLDKSEGARLRITIEQLYSSSIENSNYLTSLAKENEHRSKSFKWGIITLSAAQICIFLSIVIGACK